MDFSAQCAEREMCVCGTSVHKTKHTAAAAAA
jgi:hypothetical protein